MDMKTPRAAHDDNGNQGFRPAVDIAPPQHVQEAEPDERLSRDQETRANGKMHKTWDDMAEGDFVMRSREDMLRAPDKRPGFEQRWISVEANGNVLADNVSSRLGEGWLPRPIASIPKDFPVPTISDGKFAGFIGVRGMVLMERPVSIHKQAADAVRDRNRRHMQAVASQLSKVHDPGQAAFGAPRMATKTDVAKGRIPTVADDED